MANSDQVKRGKKKASKKKEPSSYKQTSTFNTDIAITSSFVGNSSKSPDNRLQLGSFNKKQHRARQLINLPPFRFVLPKPDCIVLDLVGTLVTSKFMSTSNEFRAFTKKHLASYLLENWRKKQLRVVINYFRGSQNSYPSEIRLREKSESREDQILQAKRHILFRMKNEPESPSVALFMLGITEWGYSKKLLVTPVYDEIHNTLKNWSELYKFPVYVAVGSADFLLMILSATSDGNLIPYFKGHMNLMDFDGNKANKDFKKLISLLKFQPNRVLYLTRFRSDARRAMDCGITAVVVLRPDFDRSNIIPLVHKWRLKNPNPTVITRSAGTPNHPQRTMIPKEITARKEEERGFMSKLSSAFGLEMLIGGAASTETQRNILMNAPNEFDTTKIKSYEADSNLHQRSSQILEEDLDFYRVILSLDELDFT